MTQRFSDRDRGYNDLVRQLEDMRAEVLVGIQQEQGVTPSEVRVAAGVTRAGTGSDITVAKKAYFNEFGLGVPERPAFRSAFDGRQGTYAARLQEDLGYVLDGDLSLAQAMARLGEQAKADVQQSITDLSAPANSARTKARKGSDNPLIDTGQMVQSVRYKVVERGQAGEPR